MWITDALGSKYAEVLYQLRCDIVHAGTAQIYENEQGIFLAFGNEIGGAASFTHFRIISIESLCREIFTIAESWCTNRGADEFNYTFVFDLESNDDRLLYRRLNDEARTDFLEKKFRNEVNDRKNP